MVWNACLGMGIEYCWLNEEREKGGKKPWMRNEHVDKTQKLGEGFVILGQIMLVDLLSQS